MDYRGYHGLHDMCYFLQYCDSRLETIIVTKLETIAVNNIHKNLLIFLCRTSNEDSFFRANTQFIIARKAIRDIDLWFGSRLSVNLQIPLPERIIISKTKTPVFKRWIAAEQ